jgi:alkylation response protein AidB-like acyl-CoA dehydrogenase
VKLPRDALLGEQPDAKRYLELTDLARIAWCALAVGTAQAVLDYVIPYCNDRVAFGEPISHRQAVAFMIADMAIEIDGMRMVMLRAASRAEQGLDFHRETYLARVLCGERAMEIGTNGVQLLGGHGYIKDHPVERWYRDLRAAGIFEGGLLI